MFAVTALHSSVPTEALTASSDNSGGGPSLLLIVIIVIGVIWLVSFLGDRAATVVVVERSGSSFFGFFVFIVALVLLFVLFVPNSGLV